MSAVSLSPVWSTLGFIFSELIWTSTLVGTTTRQSLTGRHTLRTFLVVLALAGSSASATASGLYRWVDENGDVHFGDQPPAGVETRGLQGTVNGYSSGRALTSDSEAGDTNTSPQVTMYSASWCGVCKTARRYMKQNNISFRELDVDNSKHARRQWKRLGGKGVPVIVIGNKVMHGFSESRLAALRNP